MDRSADALPHAREAADICRDLVAVDPGRYRPDLAAALTNLVIPLLVLGKNAEAEEAYAEALALGG